MQSTLLQTKPAFSWKARLGTALLFWFFSTLLQAIIYLTGYSGTNGLRDSLLYSSLWLIPVFLFRAASGLLLPLLASYSGPPRWRR